MIFRLECLFIFAISSFIFAGNAISGTAKIDGMEALQNKRYKEAVELLLPEADRNDPEVLGAIGAAYFHLDERKNDMARAAPYLERAAEMGNARALHYLGIIASDYYLSENLGKPQNFPASLALFRKAADGGYAHSAATLIQAFLKLRPPSGWLPGRFAPNAQGALTYSEVLNDLTGPDHSSYRWHLQLIGAAEWSAGNTLKALDYLQRSNDPRALHDVAAVTHRLTRGVIGYRVVLNMYEDVLKKNYKGARWLELKNELYVSAHINMFEVYFGKGRNENALICLVKTLPFLDNLPYYNERMLKRRFAGAYKRLALRTNVKQLMGKDRKNNAEFMKILISAEACRMTVPHFYKRLARLAPQLLGQVFKSSDNSREPILIFLPPRRG